MKFIKNVWNAFIFLLVVAGAVIFVLWFAALVEAFSG